MSPDEKRAIASLLAVIALGALIFAFTGTAPEPVPDWALRNEGVYRLEVALAIFLLLYVPVAAVALARQGRLFTKLTAGPATAEAEAAVAEAAEETAAALRDLRIAVDQVRGSSAATLQTVALLGQRLTGLERR